MISRRRFDGIFRQGIWKAVRSAYSSLQPVRLVASPERRDFSILMHEPKCGALLGPGERNAFEQEPDREGARLAAFRDSPRSRGR